jgi:hypothetical protein
MLLSNQRACQAHLRKGSTGNTSRGYQHPTLRHRQCYRDDAATGNHLTSGFLLASVRTSPLGGDICTDWDIDQLEETMRFVVGEGESGGKEGEPQGDL